MLRVGRHPLPVTMNNGLFLFLEMTPTPSFCTVLTNLVWYRSVTTRNGERLRLSKRNSSRQPPSLLSSITFITLSLPSTIHVLSLMAHTQFLRDYSPIGQPTNIIHAQCLSTDRCTILLTASVETGHITGDSVQWQERYINTRWKVMNAKYF